MPEMMNNLLDKIISAPEWVPPENIKEKVLQHMQSGVGIVEAVSQVFWVRIEKGEIIPMNDADSTQVEPKKWLSARFFNSEMELRFYRVDDKFRFNILSEKAHQLEKGDYRDTWWLLSGKKRGADNNEWLMEEPQIAPYRLPQIEGVETPVLLVRQYIDYEADTGLAKIVAERFVEIGEEKKNG